MVLTTDEIVGRLRQVAATSDGDPFPEWIGGPNECGPVLAHLCSAAADEIERLRAVVGAVSSGPSFAELTEGIGIRRVVMTGDGISIIQGDKRDA